MTAMGNTFENDLAKLIFQATAIANIADNAASSPLTSLYLALHTGDPGEAGDQTTSEATYTSYARTAATRNSGGFTVTANVVTNTGAVNFPACTGGSNSVTYLSIGVAASGASKIIARMALTAALAVESGITPSFAAGAISVTLD